MRLVFYCLLQSVGLRIGRVSHSHVYMLFSNVSKVLPATFGFHLLLQSYPYFRASYVISVRRTKSLPIASFRFRLTMDTLAFRLYTSSLPRRVRDFHPLERPHGVQKKGVSFLLTSFPRNKTY